MLRNAGGHGSKIRELKGKKWHFNYTIDTWETLLERKKTQFFRRIVDIQKTAFSWNYQSAECTLLLNAPKLSYTVLTLIWWLPLFQVSGEIRQSDKESHLQETPRYNIPLSGTTRLDSLSSSVANGEFSWYRVSFKSALIFLWAKKPGTRRVHGPPNQCVLFWTPCRCPGDEWFAWDNGKLKCPRTLLVPNHRAAIRKCYKKPWSSP